METLRETFTGSAKCKRHKRCRQGTATVHKQVTNSVGHGVRADKEPLEDLPVGADGDPQGEHRGPQRKRPTLRHGSLVEQEVERKANREGCEGVGQLVVGDDLVEEAEHEAQRPRQRRHREAHGGQTRTSASGPRFLVPTPKSICYSPGCVKGVFSALHMQNRAYDPGTPTNSATPNTQGPEGRPLHAARPYKDALGRIRVIPSGYRLCGGGVVRSSAPRVDKWPPVILASVRVQADLSYCLCR